MSAVCCFDFGCGCFIGCGNRMLLLSKPKRGMDAAQLSFDCDTVSHLCRVKILPFAVYWLDVYRNIGTFCGHINILADTLQRF